MLRLKARFLAGTCLPLMVVAAAPFVSSDSARAQSTASQILETVVISGAREDTGLGGLIQAEQAPKSISTITQEYLATQPAGQTVIQSLNLLPGVNFTNSDPYGSSGGNIRLRGFDGARVSLMLDGMPLNDSGNYAVFTNQLVDPEIVAKTTVNLGTTDVDSPTASATGGTINVVTLKPTEDSGLNLRFTGGSFNYQRASAMIETGSFGPWNTAAWFEGSEQTYNKFKGPGKLEKQQVNGRIYQALGESDFMSIAFHYNENRNAFYRNLSKPQIDFYGDDYDNLRHCKLTTPGAGAQNDGATTVATNALYMTANDNPINPASCTNYYGLRINPSNTGNIRGQSLFSLSDSVKFTFDPSFQYVLANGGGTTVVAENDGRLRGKALSPGVDLNGDGDILDQVRLYTPNNTNTYRYGIGSSVIWEINDTDRLRASYTLDYARHRQTGEFSKIDAQGNPSDVFGGKWGGRVFGADGSFLDGRDRFSIAKLNQFSISYNGTFADDRLNINAGVRAPFFSRELNQHCYSQNGTSTVRCTTEPVSLVLPNGDVRLNTQGTTEYIPPYTASVKYDAILPNVGVSFRPWSDPNLFFASYAEGLSALRTDNLYTPKRVGNSIERTSAQPERTKAFDLGYRYQGDMITGSLAAWVNKFDNRIVTAFDDTLGISVDRNLGKVNLEGVDAELGINATDDLSFYSSASYIHSQVEENIPLTATTVLQTKGKQLVETPDWTFSGRVQYKIGSWRISFQGKYVGDRYSTDVNDEVAPNYTVFDADLRYNLSPFGLDGSYLQFNVTNIFDEQYLGSISSTNNAVLIPNVSTTSTVVARTPLAPTYSIGSPRTFQMSLNMAF